MCIRTKDSITLFRESYFVARDFTYHTANKPMSKAWKDNGCSLDVAEMAISQPSPAAFSINGVR